jgi:hypothetical protein
MPLPGFRESQPTAVEPGIGGFQLTQDDRRTVALTFIGTAMAVLMASMFLDTALAAIILTGATDLGALAACRLATELLPVAFVFTATAMAIAGVALLGFRRQIGPSGNLRSEPDNAGFLLPAM